MTQDTTQKVEPVNTNDLRDYADRISNPYSQFVIDAANELDAARAELAEERAKVAKMQTPTIQWDPDNPEQPIDSVEDLAESFVDYGNMHGVFSVDNAHVLPSTYHYFEAGVDDDTGNVGETYCIEITKDEYNGARAAMAVGWFAKKAKWATDRLAAALAKETP